MLTTTAPCRIRVTTKIAPKALAKVMKDYSADDIEPAHYKCLRCKLDWDAQLADYRSVTCSGCYSDNVAIVSVRLGFMDWGVENGGAAEQRKRYTAAINTATALAGRRSA